MAPTRSGQPGYQAPGTAPWASSHPSTRAVHASTPYGPRRWAQSRRKSPSAASAARRVPGPGERDQPRARPDRHARARARPPRRRGRRPATAPPRGPPTGPRRPPARRRAARRRPAPRSRRRSGGRGAGGRRRRRWPRPSRRRRPARRWPPRARAAPSGRILAPARAGPTTSPRTAPASTETSCSGSPTSTRRASSRSASSSRAISDSEIIDASSTTTSVWGRGLARSWRKRLSLSGRRPRSRWMVEPPSASRRARVSSPDRHRGRLLVDGLLEARGRLAGRGRQRDAPGVQALDLVHQGQDARDRGGLAGARSSGDHAQPAQERRGGRRALLGEGLAGEQAGERVAKGRGIRERPARPARRRRSAATARSWPQ